MPDDLREDSTDTSESDDLYILVIVLLLIIILFILEKVGNKVDTSSNGKRTNRLMIGVIIANATFTSSHLLYETMCLHCPVQYVLMMNTRWIMRWFNWLFLIHRAKLAQGMTPILSKKWFTKILPTIISFFTVLFLFMSTFHGLQKETMCRTYTSIGMDIEHCSLSDGYDGAIGALKAFAVFIVGFDLIITVFLLTMFVVPLYRVYSTDLGALNSNQLRQRRKLRTLLIWSVTMCFINQITSTFFVLPGLADTPVIWVLFDIGRFDPAINVCSLWLMITRNRKYLRKVFNCTCCRSDSSEHIKTRRHSLQSALSNVSEMERYSRADLFLRMFTRSQSHISTRSVNDLQLVLEEGPNIQNAPV